MIYALWLAVAGSFALVCLGIFPGVLGDVALLAVLTSCLWVPALGLAGLFILIPHLRRRRKSAKPIGDFAGVGEPDSSHRRRSIVASSVLVLNIVLLMAGVPGRLAFAVSRPAFEEQLATAPTSAYGGAPLDRRLGVYYVDRFAADPRGGVYFRTHTGADGIGPDTMSYGFAFRPNPVGTPFGRAGYSYSRLSGGWFIFRASNDF